MHDARVAVLWQARAVAAKQVMEAKAAALLRRAEAAEAEVAALRREVGEPGRLFCGSRPRLRACAVWEDTPPWGCCSPLPCESGRPPGFLAVVGT